MQNRKGSVMVEAAIIYPLVIGAIMAIIYIMICMYTGNSIKANLNIELRNQAFELTQTGEIISSKGKFAPDDKYGRKAFNQKIFIKKQIYKGRNILYGNVRHSYKGNSMMSDNIMRTHEGTVFLIDEKDYIRKVDMIL